MKNSQPTVSVIVPAFNVEKYIIRCLSSICAQTLPRIEVIVVDDGSRDKTVDLIKSFAHEHSQVKFSLCAQNYGNPGVPRNIGILQARGEYIGFVDSDDWIDVCMYERLYQEAKSCDYDIVSTGSFFIHENNSLVSEKITYYTIDAKLQNNADAFASTYFSNTVNRIYKRSFISKNNIFFPNMYISEDFCFSAASHGLAANTSSVSEGFYHYTYNRVGSTTHHRIGLKAFELVNSFQSSIEYFKKLRCFDRYALSILAKYINSFRYTYERLDKKLRLLFLQASSLVLSEYKEQLNMASLNSNDKVFFEKLRLDWPNNREATFAYANSLFKEKQYIQAIVAFNKISTTNDILRKQASHNAEMARKKLNSLIAEYRLQDVFDKLLTQTTSPQCRNDIDANSTTQRLVVKNQYFYPYGSGKRIYHGGKRVNGHFFTKNRNTPLVTVITTVYNNVRYIEQAMLSVFSQTYNHIEYIIVDANSTDGTRQLIKKYESKLDYFFSAEDKGLYEGLNRGLSLSSGDYIIILNSDDFFEKDAIEKLLNKAVETDSEIVFGSVNLLDLNDTKTGVLHSAWNSALCIRCPARHGAMLASTHAYEQIGLYDESKKVISDQLWMLKAYEQNLRVQIINNVVLNFRQTGVSSCENQVHCCEQNDVILEVAPGLDEITLNKVKYLWRLSLEEIVDICSDYYFYPKFKQALSVTWREKTIGANRPLISVQVPVYNAEKFLDECLHSIQTQTYKNFEVVCVDDGSSDKSCEIINKYCKNDMRFLLFNNHGIKGTLQARKKAFEVATGDYMAFVDADDIMKPTMLEELYCKAVECGADLVQCGAEIFDPSHILPPEILSHYSKYYADVPKCGVVDDNVFQLFVRKIKSNFWLSLVEKNVYKNAVKHIPDSPLLHGNDNLVMFFISYYAKRFTTVDKLLYLYRASSSSSNLIIPTGCLVKDHIVSRSEMLHYAKNFIKTTAPNYSLEWPPFDVFFESTKNYCKRLLDRCIEHHPELKEELEFLFSSRFELHWHG